LKGAPTWIGKVRKKKCIGQILTKRVEKRERSLKKLGT